VGAGTWQAACPRCGSADDVHTASELFDMLNAMRAGVMQQAAQRDLPPPSSGEGWFPDPRYDPEPGSADLGQGVADVILGLAGGLFSKRISKRVRRGYEQRIGSRAQQAQQAWDQSVADQAVIVERYPDLRGCLRDQVLFLAGGAEAVPLSSIRFPVTLAQAESIVARLNG
jgi:hypothetical protein